MAAAEKACPQIMAEGQYEDDRDPKKHSKLQRHRDSVLCLLDVPGTDLVRHPCAAEQIRSSDYRFNGSSN